MSFYRDKEIKGYIVFLIFFFYVVIKYRCGIWDAAD